MHKSLFQEIFMKEVIFTSEAPNAVGPYSQAVKAGNTIYLSGQLGLDPATGKMVEGGVAAQAQQALKNICAVLKSQNATVDNVVKTTVFLADIADFQAFNAEYAKVFTKDFPARSCFAVKQLPLGGLVEIECVVVL